MILRCPGMRLGGLGAGHLERYSLAEAVVAVVGGNEIIPRRDVGGWGLAAHPDNGVGGVEMKEVEALALWRASGLLEGHGSSD